MTVLHRIPPMISALAFGYGVGMAAPEGAISSVKDAVGTYAPAPARQAPLSAAGAAPAGASALPPASTLFGREAEELSRLRDAGGRDRRTQSCDLDRPTHSRAPRYESRGDGFIDDTDDLDAAGTEALSRLQLPDLKLAITRRTLKYVRFFARTDRGRGMYEAWLKRSGRYQDMVQRELREWRLPDDLMWLAMIESGFDARIKSPAGAVGLWQFMPATGAVYGLQQNKYIDQRRNPKLATQAAAHHLRDLYMRFGDWNLALAAYNMGYEQLLDAIDRYGTADFNELARQEAIPSETAAYVPKIAAAAIVANNLEHFGFDRVEYVRPIDGAEIAVPPGTTLRTLAKAAGVSTATLRNHNPDLLSDRVPPGRGDYLVQIPSDTVARAQAALPALLQTEPLAVDDASVLNPVDLVGGREFLGRRKIDDDGSLLSLLPPPKKRRSLRDPVGSGRDDVAEEGGDDEEPARGRLARRLGAGRDAEARDDADERRDSRGPSLRTIYYRVAPGDSLIGIARQFGVDVDGLARANNLDADAKVKEGALLRLRVGEDLVSGGSRVSRARSGGGASDDARKPDDARRPDDDARKADADAKSRTKRATADDDPVDAHPAPHPRERSSGAGGKPADIPNKRRTARRTKG